MTMKNMVSVLFLLLLPQVCVAEAEVKTDVDMCYDYLFALPELSPIADKLNMRSLGLAEPTFEQLANVEKAIDSEKVLISKLSKGFDFCEGVRNESIKSNTPLAVILAYENNNARRKSLLIDLYNQKITYGEYLEQRQESKKKLKREVDAVWAEIDQENAKIDAHNARINAMQEAQRRRELANTFGNIGDAIRNSRPPRAINCNPNGFGGVRCQ